jgi:DNA-binding NarL/FixJ family response regulator
MASDPITLVIADDHAVLRKGLRLLLEAEPDFQVVGEAGDVPRRSAPRRRISRASSSST